MSAVAVAKDVFAQRKIEPDQLAPASAPLLPLDQTAEAQRAVRNEQLFGATAPGVLQYTTDILFRDLWLRPILRRGIAVWSRSARSSRPAKSHKSPTTLTARWATA